MVDKVKKIELVFIPSPGIGHIVSMVQMAKLIVARDPRLSITVLVIKRPGATAAVNIVELVPVDQTRIRFLHLREPDPVSIIHLNAGDRFFASIGELQLPIVREAIAAEVLGRPGSGNLAGLIIDMFCACMVDVAKEFHVPSYIYFPCNAASLGQMYHMKALRDEHGTDGSEFMNSDVLLDIPFFSHPYPAKVLPTVSIDEALGSTTFLNLTKKFNESNGIVINTFAELESRAIRVISEIEKFPPVYSVGPILNHEKSVGEEHDEIMRWLDGQPPSSVVYLCFGSMGTFGEAQVKEIAMALEKSRHRFLWSLRLPPSIKVPITEVLPEGFLERTGDVGKLVGWTPQVEVLSHNAVGGFVSHCGWNSTLESLWCGVPVAAWPMFAEQQLNAFLLVKELELAVEVKMEFRQNPFSVNVDDIVAASVIEGAIRRLMDVNEMRKKVKDMSQMSRKAVMEGGSSYVSLGRFIEDVIHNAHCGDLSED
ncbi:anthocyanidin 3-O-glucosyltransferase 2-like [Impatiens glandulifera]|uniref:anthocyanidin 3-O-glucosyltransferase 2-like n=1 Tax=Impatiens glandulifera TaxID=253017 RepID=UPI001FB0B914|nr:anthocyanidin 3-O-glucosyltransferase 2-like [Impatiens glandulifera]